MKLFYQYMTIFITFTPTLIDIYQLQIDCGPTFTRHWGMSRICWVDAGAHV